MIGNKQNCQQFSKEKEAVKAGNFRPVSIGCVMCTHLRDHIVEHMMTNDIFSHRLHHPLSTLRSRELSFHDNCRRYNNNR